MIKVIDLFAGPGGLGEGFASFESKGMRVFDIVLSIEKDQVASQTLKLRTFFRLFDYPPREYYRFLRQEIDFTELVSSHSSHWAQAERAVWNVEIGPAGIPYEIVRERVKQEVGRSDEWVLVGGPPCQAYSLIGRARNRGNPNYDASTDVRQKLYVEYLQILADHSPPIFVMENVKGLMSATLGNAVLFDRILADLRNPAAAIRREGRTTRGNQPKYALYSLSSGGELQPHDVGKSIVKSELYGIPQTRHRVVLFGIRADVRSVSTKLRPGKPAIVDDVLTLPKVRSGLSGTRDSKEEWLRTLRAQLNTPWLRRTAANGGAALASRIRDVLRSLTPPREDRGGEFLAGDVAPSYASRWYHDQNLGGAINHTTRAHIPDDLFRYLFAACFGQVFGRSPVLRDFPKELLPAHSSAIDAGGLVAHFADRFRVQLADRPSSTVVSHISKDGHYYIHPDPAQCRSLTVREAARLQTFPDNYFFCGPRTSQFVQVGNAVPPLLARQIARVAYSALGG
jgi:DNA (cytosine-5)-methyltransferase 1